MKLNLGSGENYREGWVNIEISKEVKADYYLDLSVEPLPFEDNTVDFIEARDFLEHIINLKHIFNECWRVLKPAGVFYIEVPYAGTVDYYKDPTHVRPFIPETFNYFAIWNTSPAYGLKKWDIIEEKHTLGGFNQNRIFISMTPQK